MTIRAHHAGPLIACAAALTLAACGSSGPSVTSLRDSLKSSGSVSMISYTQADCPAFAYADDTGNYTVNVCKNESTAKSNVSAWQWADNVVGGSGNRVERIKNVVVIVPAGANDNAIRAAISAR